MSKQWIQSAVKKKGGLHQSLGVPQNQVIPQQKISAKKSAIQKKEKNGNLSQADSKTMKQISLAETLRNLHK